MLDRLISGWRGRSVVIIDPTYVTPGLPQTLTTEAVVAGLVVHHAKGSAARPLTTQTRRKRAAASHALGAVAPNLWSAQSEAQHWLSASSSAQDRGPGFDATRASKVPTRSAAL